MCDRGAGESWGPFRDIRREALPGREREGLEAVAVGASMVVKVSERK